MVNQFNNGKQSGNGQPTNGKAVFSKSTTGAVLVDYAWKYPVHWIAFGYSDKPTEADWGSNLRRLKYFKLIKY